MVVDGRWTSSIDSPMSKQEGKLRLKSDGGAERGAART